MIRKWGSWMTMEKAEAMTDKRPQAKTRPGKTREFILGSSSNSKMSSGGDWWWWWWWWWWWCGQSSQAIHLNQTPLNSHDPNLFIAICRHRKPPVATPSRNLSLECRHQKSLQSGLRSTKVLLDRSCAKKVQNKKKAFMYNILSTEYLETAILYTSTECQQVNSSPTRKYPLEKPHEIPNTVHVQIPLPLTSP